MCQNDHSESKVWNELADEQVGATVLGENFIIRIISKVILFLGHVYTRTVYYRSETELRPLQTIFSIPCIAVLVKIWV